MTPHRLVPKLTDTRLAELERQGNALTRDMYSISRTELRILVDAYKSPPAVGSGAVASSDLAEVVISVLDSRCGFDHWWGDIDEECQAEIMDEIASKIDRARNATPTPPHAWMDIATAPRDGTEIWAFNGEQARMHWISGDGYALWVWSDELLREVDAHPEQPTHWMHLPSKPGEPTAPAPASPLVRGLERIVARIDKLDWRDKSHVCDYGKACEAVREMASRALLEQQAQP